VDPVLPNTHLHFSGFSETRSLANVAIRTFRCPKISLEQRDYVRCTRSRSGHDDSFIALCREDPSAARIEMTGHCAGNMSVSWRWKSLLANDASDDGVRRFLSNGIPRLQQRRVLIVSAGIHHFAAHESEFGQFMNETQQGLAVPDSWRAPQAWIDRWRVDLNRSLDRLVEWKRSLRSCVIWKTNNVAKRLPGATHGVSTLHGLTNLLNEEAVAAARARGLAVFDVTPLTLATRLTQAPNASTGVALQNLYHGHDDAKIFARLWSGVRSGALCRPSGQHSGDPTPITPNSSTAPTVSRNSA